MSRTLFLHEGWSDALAPSEPTLHLNRIMLAPVHLSIAVVEACITEDSQ